MKNLYKRAAALAAIATVSTASFADTLDLSAITGAFTKEDIIAGVLAVGLVLMTVHVAIKGARVVIGMVGK